MKKQKNIEFIERAYSLIKNQYIFHKNISYLKGVCFKNVTNEDHTKIEYIFKAIRQDCTKILVIMNTIDKIYLEYKEDKYVCSYSSIKKPALQELGCFIEYLFVKYRVIFEYIQQIMEICIPPIFTNDLKGKYNKLKKTHEKYNFLLDYIVKETKDTSGILNMDLFQDIRIERNSIVHSGATCWVPDDKKDLMFKIMSTDALDKEEEFLDEFFSNEKNCIYYRKYWGLQISKLIVFGEIILEFLINLISNDLSYDVKQRLNLNFQQGRNKFITDDKELDDVQDVLCKMLENLIEENKNYKNKCKYNTSSTITT